MISVVVPAYNEEKTIARCLGALSKQKTEEKFEVILVDNNCTDKTVEIANTFKDKLDLLIIKEKKQGRGAARHAGFLRANSKIVLSSDSDAVVPEDWLETLKSKLVSSGAVAVTGTCYINDCSKLTNISFNFFQPISMHFYKLVFRTYWLSGFSFGIYKDIYEKSGGFSSRLNAQEDIDLAFKVAKLGNIRFFGDKPVLFSGRRFKKGLLIGLYPYIATFFEYHFFRKHDMVLSDVR